MTTVQHATGASIAPMPLRGRETHVATAAMRDLQRYRLGLSQVRDAVSTWLRLVLLCTLVMARVCCAESEPPASKPPCDPGGITVHEPLGSRLHEWSAAYKSHNQRDQRAWEQEVELKNGINCLAEKLNDLVAATTDDRSITDQRRGALQALLAKVSDTLDALSTKIRPGVPPAERHESNALPSALTAINAMTLQLVHQNQVLERIQTELNHRDATAPIDVTTVSYAAATVQSPRADTSPRDQIDPTVPVERYFKDSLPGVEFALASIPDPRVPRHRRQYDNAITAINQGMLSAGFVLDRYGFPWAKDLRVRSGTMSQEESGLKATAAHSDSNPYVADDDRYGLMLFRRDNWREQTVTTSSREVEVRALYVITETGTYGIQRAALQSALLKIDEQVTPALEGLAPASPVGSGCNGTTAAPAGDAILFGPTFSGSLDSVRETMLELSRCGSAEKKLQRIQSLRVLSSSATVDTNEQVGKSGRFAVEHLIDYHTFARTDLQKLQFIDGLRSVLNVDPEKVAVVYESTTFGMEACKDYATRAGSGIVASAGIPTICAKALKLPVPVNIADVRFGLREKAAAQAREAKSKSLLSRDTARLSLEEGAENGSEFPESQQSPLTSVSTELELERLIDALRTTGSELVVIIATDVRDRLFLIEQISGKLSGALFVDLGADRLLAHPDFIHATRGVLTLSSSPLTSFRWPDGACALGAPCQRVYQVWSTDEQSTLASSLTAWFKKPEVDPWETLIPYVVSRTGLVSNQDMLSSRLLRKVEVIGAVFLSIVFSLLGVAFVIKNRGKALIATSKELTLNAVAVAGVVVVGALLIWLTTRDLVIAALCGVASFCILFWSKQICFAWSAAIIWLSTLLLLITTSLEASWGLNWTLGQPSHAAVYVTAMRSLLAALSQSAAGGLDYPLAQCFAVGTMITTVLISQCIATSTTQSEEALSNATSLSNLEALKRPGRNAGLVIVCMGLAVSIIAPAMFLCLGARQVTVFGQMADFSAYISLIATTLIAVCMLIGAIAAVARIRCVCNLVKEGLRETHDIDTDSFRDTSKQPLGWIGLSGPRAEFVSTPVMASWWTGGPSVRTLRMNIGAWQAELKSLLAQAPISAQGLQALYALLASEMAAYQFCVAGVAVATISSSVIVYLFPVSQAGGLIVLNLAALLIAGVYSAYQTVSFEGNMILSNVLCNRTQQREWSISLFMCIVIPFVILAIAIGIGQIPGVLYVGNGILETILKWVKPGG